MKCIILSGPINWGKTSLLKRLFSELKKKRISVGGFISQKKILKDSRLYFASFPNSKEEFFLVEVFSEGLKYCPENFLEVEKKVLKQIDSPVLVIDEIGPLEALKKGHARLFKKIVKHYKGVLIISCRPSFSHDLLTTLKNATLLEKPSIKRLIKSICLK